VQRDRTMTFKLMIDSSVWLDNLQDQRLDPILTAIEELIFAGAVSLIVPEQVLVEFDRNKGKVKDERKNTLLGTVKRFRQALSQIDGTLSGIKPIKRSMPSTTSSH
jgi:predicted nucleic acid-binding protein